MLPKIRFKYSWIYDRMWQEAYRRKGKPKTGYPPNWKKLERYAREIELIWRRIEKKVLREMEKISSLGWKKREIICYIVTKCRPFSAPLTIRVYKDKTYFIDILVHELFHNLFTQNQEKYLRYYFRYLKKKYPKYYLMVRSHILLYAMHKKLYLDYFGKKRLLRDIEKANQFAKKYPEYKKAWEIVEKEGYESIIKEFKRGLK